MTGPILLMPPWARAVFVLMCLLPQLGFLVLWLELDDQTALQSATITAFVLWPPAMFCCMIAGFVHGRDSTTKGSP